MMANDPEPAGNNSSLPIQDYAIIGNSRSAALIGSNGSMDWLCLPRFDSASIFAAILDPVRGGRFQICPRQVRRVRRRYVGETVVLETRFETDTGEALLTDFVPVAAEPEKRHNLWPEYEIIRHIECTRGEVEIELLCDPRFDYARQIPRPREHGRCGWVFEAGRQSLIIRSEIAHGVRQNEPGLFGRERLRQGEVRFSALAYNREAPSVLPPLGKTAAARLAATLEWWERWSKRCRYKGPFREQVIRSALTLKLMVFAPSGAVVAAPTTSLPEWIGAGRNWDYRYCWLRDASMTIRAMIDLGYEEDADAFLSWLLHTTRLTWPKLRVMYDVYGRKVPDEEDLDHLSGYSNSKPVRVGNGARDQLQLDTYGALIHAAFRILQHAESLDHDTARALLGFGETVCRCWTEPDRGIWELRGGNRHNTLSKVMCWVALDHLLALDKCGLLSVPRERFERNRGELKQAIESQGFNRELGAYVSEFGGREVDASLLLLPLYRYIEAANPRMVGTRRLIQERLGNGVLLRRYPEGSDGLPSSEGAFGICSFWAIENQARGGDLEGAEENLARMLRYGNDVGLFAEEIEPETGAALGNFPQAYTHVGVINVAYAIAAAKGESGERRSKVEKKS